ncbi:MAG: GntR family transcriptional regulator [Acidobacteria bacterium]|nr:GntR family transcriptional regulator [Acidobacteriota bacterium]
MEFFIQKNSSLPAHAQIRDQVKVALLLGNLRPGEILPSIRDLEKQLGIGPNIVRRAYGELEELGILRMIHGKGVMINKNLKYKDNRALLEACEKLIQRTRSSCQSLGLIYSSFAKLQQQKATERELAQPPLIYADMNIRLANERAQRLSEILNVNMRGCSTDDLKELRDQISKGTKIVCNYYRFGEVSRILRRQRLKIIPLRMTYGNALKEELNSLRPGSKVMFIGDDVDNSAMPLILEDYKRAFPNQHLEVVSYRAKDSVRRLIKSNKYAKFIVSNRIWDTIPAEIQKRPDVIRPVLDFDPSSIEESKIDMGIIA